MMGLGSLNNGGFSSSSCLSALAPPFTVDRSTPKTNSSPLIHFTDSPFSAPFNSSPQEWLYPHNNSVPGPDYLLSPVLETNPVPSSISYRFSEPQPALSSATSLTPLKTNSYSDRLITSVAQTNPYYPQYVPLSTHENSPLVTLNEPAYNVLPASSAASLGRSYQDDYTLSLSGLEYPAVWGDGYWNKLPEREWSKQIKYDGRFGPKKESVAVPSVYSNCNYSKEVINTDTVTAGYHHTCGELLAEFDRKSIHTQARETCIQSLTTKQLYDKGNPKLLPMESSRTSVLGSNFSNPEASFEPSVLESSSTSGSFERPYGALHERMRFSPAVVIRPPSSGTNSPARDVFSSKNANFCSSVGGGYDDDFVGCSQSNRKVPHLPLGWQRKEVGKQDLSQISIGKERDDPAFVKSYAMEEKEVLHDAYVTKGAANQVEKASPGLQDPHINDLDNVQLFVRTEATSEEKSLESLDYHNPAVDSPCWKGAPASPLTSCEVSEDTAQLLAKKFNASNGFIVQGPVFPMNTDDAIKVSFQKFDESTIQHVDECFQNSSFQRPLVTNLMSSGQRSEDATKDGTGKEDALPELKDDTDFSIQRMQPKPEEVRFSYGIKAGSGNGSVDTGNCAYDVSENLLDGGSSLHVSGGDSMQFNATEFALGSPFTPFAVEDVPAKPADPNEGKPAPKMNAQTLVAAMHNLSELLLVNCSYDSCGLNEHDHESLMHVINNLEACMLNRVEQISSRQKPLVPQESTSNLHEALPDIGKGVTLHRPLLSKEATAVDEAQHALDDIKLHYMSCQKHETADSRNNDAIAKAVKKILHDNFRGEEERLPQALLYKNLWLEAEAAICSLSYRARFNRMKIEMAKSRDQEEKGISENTIAGRKGLSRPGVSHDAKLVRISTSEVSSSPILHIQGTPVSITASNVDNLETSVMTRFHILKCRGENSNSMNSGEQLATGVIDGGFSNKEVNWTVNGDIPEDHS